LDYIENKKFVQAVVWNNIKLKMNAIKNIVVLCLSAVIMIVDAQVVPSSWPVVPLNVRKSVI
jgi:hypothetical protein